MSKQHQVWDTLNNRTKRDESPQVKKTVKKPTTTKATNLTLTKFNSNKENNLSTSRLSTTTTSRSRQSLSDRLSTSRTSTTRPTTSSTRNTNTSRLSRTTTTGRNSIARKPLGSSTKNKLQNANIPEKGPTPEEIMVEQKKQIEQFKLECEQSTTKATLLEEQKKQLEEKMDERDSKIRKLERNAKEKDEIESELHTLKYESRESVSKFREVEYELTAITKIKEKLENENLELKILSKQLESEVKQVKIEQRLELESLKSTHQNEILTIKSQLQDKENEFKLEVGSLKSNLQNKMDAMEIEYEGRIQNVRDENSRTIRNLKDTSQKEIRNIQSELDNTKIDLEYSIEEGKEKNERICKLEEQLKEKVELINTYLEKIQKDEMLRRALHNQIQELKGNIRVYCRVRPPIKSVDGSSYEVDHMNFTQDRNGHDCGLDVEGPAISNVSGTSSNTKKYNFSFDRVFKPESKQDFVFDEISQLVQSALDGYKVCIFAYGQTGSGKTYTMEGPENGISSPELKGMIPRSVEQIFKTAEYMATQGWKYKIVASFLEIYNENIQDLLRKKNSNLKYDIRHDSGNTSVTGLEYYEVNEPNEVFSLLKRATKNRSVGSTDANERSSRSHSVFSLQITGVNESSDLKTFGVLNLIDLAGSERLKESKATGDRLKETQNINSSLSCLGDVISALAAKEKHIPFRNSKLTYLLQNYLGEDSKTLMFVNISPKQESLQETLHSLRFAAKVNSCQIGTARKKVTSAK
eukprot:gene4574-7958_t